MGNETMDPVHLYASPVYSKENISCNYPLSTVDKEDDDGTLKIVPGPILHAYEWSDFLLSSKPLPRLQSSPQLLSTHHYQQQSQELAHKQLAPEKTQKKSVSFSNLEIREHNVIFGDHPCSSKLPISLGWEHASSTIKVEIDSYENSRSNYRRVGSDIRLSERERKNILKRVGGMTELDIKDAQRRHSRSQRGPVHIPNTTSSSSLSTDFSIRVSSSV